MNFKLSKEDYISIIEYYGLDYNKNDKLSTLKSIVDKIISKKLCSCIKKVKDKYNDSIESRAIAICNKSVIQNKFINIYKFSCKKKPKLLLPKSLKSNTNKIYKTDNANIILKNKKTKKQKNKKNKL